MKKLLILVSSLLAFSVALGQTLKPKLRIANDGFPAGHGTPEGAASDLARAFINSDVALFSDTCIKPYGGGQNREDYTKFLETVIERMKQESRKNSSSPKNPKGIGKVFAARHLSATGPTSYGYVSFAFQDIMFVDVGVFLQNGERELNRTLVIKDKEGKWYVHPSPDLSPLLSVGLNDEKPSVQDFTEAYDIQK